MKKIILMVCLLAFAINLCVAQDSTALINTTWTNYASDTSLTFRQIITTCDSQFAAAGYPVFPDTATGGGGSYMSVDSGADEDGSPFYAYIIWKNFWSTRCDVATGKLHSFAREAGYVLGGGTDTTNCAGTSALQTNTVAIPSAAPGWAFIGPQKIFPQLLHL